MQYQSSYVATNAGISPKIGKTEMKQRKYGPAERC